MRKHCFQAVEADDPVIEAAAAIAGFVDEYFVDVEAETAKVG